MWIVYNRRVFAWSVCVHATSLADKYPASLCLQLRVIRAFKSTLEDLEERRSIHSLHSLHSLRSSRSHTGPWPPRPLSDITYIDEDPATAKLSPQQASKTSDNRDDRLLSPNILRLPSHHQHFTHHSPNAAANAANSANNSDLPKPVHETRI
nr:unnamed protein product [Callosobruchus chinensis]